MRFKLDENLGERGRRRLVAAGHDVATVAGQSMTSSDDVTLFRVCFEEGRILVSLDLDFSNPFRFPPSESAGVVVLRLPREPHPGTLSELVEVLVRSIENGENPEGHLWIVESGRIRVYLDEENDN